ncbi:angiotensin-converting enzyme isoform X2 [Biomphalaria glabrata]|nr:angiotensin-converting enzyme isoform X2 [Biomphalaria glabrata]
MRLAEVARARAEQLIEPCRTLTTVSSEKIANLTLEHVSNDVPIDFATLCFIVSCITFVCVVILMVSLMCPPKFPPCLLRKGKQPTRRQQPRIHSMTAHLGSNDHFLTASRTGVQLRLSPVDKIYCSSGSSTTSRSTTTSVSSSSRTVTSRKMTPKSTGSPEGASALIYDKIPDTKNGCKDQNINGSSACTYSENESGDPDAPEFFTILEPPMFENQHSKTSFKNKASYDCTHNECYCKQFLLPLLKQKVCCIEDKPRQSKCCKRKRSQVQELKKAPRNIYEKTPRSHFQKDLLGPDKEAESDSMTLNTTAVNSSRIYRLPSLSQSTIKRAESCGEDMFDHSTQTPSITTDSRTLSRTPGNRDISQCSETFVCSSGPRHAGPFATLNSKPEDITSEMVVSTLSSTANHDTLTSSSCKYQGIYPPVTRTSEDFDAGSLYHISNNVYYISYFLSFVLQFQFHKALCEAAGFDGPLHRCNIYNSTRAGTKLSEMLRHGATQTWQKSLRVLTGTNRMDAQPLLDYFKPLMEYLKKENAEDIDWQPNCPFNNN